MSDGEEYGGDPPCWAHLFEEEAPGMEIETEDRAAATDIAASGAGADQVADLAALISTATAPGAIWARQSEDLNTNLLRFAAGEGVAVHVNDEVDVLLVGIAGVGAVTINGARQILSAGQALIIPKGASRGIESRSDPFAYLSCHRRRGGLRPRR